VADPRPRTFQPNPSLARRHLKHRRRGRRVDGLLSCFCRSSSIIRAGATGGTDPLVRSAAARLVELRDPEPDTLANDPATRAPSLPVRRPTRVIRQFAPSSRGVPLPVLELARPGRATQVFPRSSPDGAPGVRSLRRFGPASGWTSAHLNVTAWQLPVRRQTLPLDISAGPGPRAVRASRPPRLIFVGVTDRLWRKVRSAKAISRG